jgi:hypothetical protein
MRFNLPAQFLESDAHQRSPFQNEYFKRKPSINAATQI